MNYEWSGGPMIFIYGDPNGVTVGQVNEDNMKAIGWNAFDLTQASLVKIGSSPKLEDAKALVEAHFKPNGQAARA